MRLEKSYLSDRWQIVSISAINSYIVPVDYRVIQGSTLGPILFVIYINNIKKLKWYWKTMLFADDTYIFLD